MPMIYIEIEQRLNQAQNLKQQADSQNKALKKQMLEIKLNYERQSQLAEQEAVSRQKRQYQGSIHQIEGQLKSVEDARTSSLNQLDLVSKQADDRQSQFNSFLLSKQKEREKLHQTISQIKTENQQTSLQNCRLTSDLQVIQGNIQKQQSDLKELNAEIESHSISSSTQLKALYNETNNSRKASDASVFALNARIRQLEKSLAQARTNLKQKQERQNQISNEIVSELDHNLRSLLMDKLRIR